MTLSHTALALFAAAIVGAILPLRRGWSTRGLHQFVSITAGIFLGTVFLHLLPELATGGGHAAHLERAGEDSWLIATWIALLAGFLLLFVVERVWLAGRGTTFDPHRVLLSATFVGLSLHSTTFGLGVAALPDDIRGGWPFLVSMLSHKAAEAFSLAAVMSLAALPRPRSLLYVLLFAAMTPVGILGGQFLAGGGGTLTQVLSGFACGTFLYVAVCDLLPEVFHDTEQSWTKLGWVLLGIAISALTLPQAGGLVDFAGRALGDATTVFVQMAPYLLLGFAIAGLLSQVLRPALLTRHLARDDTTSVVKASLIGAPLPLCSCSVVPVAVSLRRGGASKGATSAFLIATPETGVDSVSVTWALLDPLMTIARPLGAILSAIFTGTLVNLFVRGGHDVEAATEAAPEPAAACCDQRSDAEAAGEPSDGERPRGFLARAMRFAFVDLLDDLAGLLIVGLLISGLITAAIPEALFQRPFAQGFSGLLLMLVVGIPIYVCAAASTPIAASLLLKGLSPGAALVFLLASPATNIASLVALSRTLGRRVLILHVTALAVVTLAIGMLADTVLPLLGWTPAGIGASEHAHLPLWLSRGSTAILALLMLASLVRTRAMVRLAERLPRPLGALRPDL